MNKSVYHLPPEVTETYPYVLLPGDPERVDLILSHLDKPEILGQRREFRVGRGRVHGFPIMVASTGIGGPSTAILAHELHVLGAKTLIRVGTSGSLSPHVRVGDLVLASGAIRDEGTSQQYLPLEFPAIASPEVLEAMRLGLNAISSHPTVHVGVVHSKDAFYAQKRPGDLPLEEYHRAVTTRGPGEERWYPRWNVPPSSSLVNRSDLELPEFYRSCPRHLKQRHRDPILIPISIVLCKLCLMLSKEMWERTALRNKETARPITSDAVEGNLGC